MSCCRITNAADAVGDLISAACEGETADNSQLAIPNMSATLNESAIEVHELDNLDPAAMQQLLFRWNATHKSFGADGDACLHELIESQAARTPDSIAVTCENGQLTYGELNRRAELLAALLRARAIGPEVFVGVCMERSLEMMIALLGTLKAGAAYVPFDPEHPVERLRLMFEDSQVAVLLTQRHVVRKLPEQSSPWICVDEPLPPASPSPALRRVSNDNLAYTIYTSGSTGQPKGAMTSHRAIVNRLLWMQAEYQLGCDDRVIQKTPYTFDVSVWEFFWPLMTGASVVLARPGGHRDFAYLATFFRELEITVTHFVPSMLGIFLEQPQIEACTSVRRVICSGEALPLAFVQRLLARLPVPLHNLYGPTEAAVDVTSWTCDNESACHRVPIGHPIANVRIYILDCEIQLAAIGLAGELHIGGVGLARGYLNRPALTAERFVPNPFGEGRLYRTGDLACWSPRGPIEYLGRTDFQVKLPGGVRIELGEVESVLREHSDVQDAAVLALENGTSGIRLVAYVAPVTDHANGVGLLRRIERRNLREYLSHRLPLNMLPSAVVFLDALPRNANGKVDRRAFPAPSESDFRTMTFVPPRTSTEQAISNIWQVVLGVTVVGGEDNFFALGGSSLQVPRALSLIRERLGIDLPLRAFYAADTLALLADQVDLAQRQTAGVPGEIVSRIPRDGNYTLAPQQEAWWYNAYLTDKINPNNIHFGVRISGPLNPATTRQAVAILQNRHEALRTNFRVRQDGSATPVVLDSGSCVSSPFTIDLSLLPRSKQDATVQHFSRLENSRAFDLTSLPLFRVSHVQLGPCEHILLFTMHHLVSDGWSNDVFLKEFSVIYEQLNAGYPPKLTELAFQYIDFAHWQRNWLSTEGANRQLVYWRHQLAPPLTYMAPLDNPGDANQLPYFSVRGRVLFEIPSEATATARGLARNERCSLFSTVVAALKLALYAYTGRSDIRVGTLAANRGLPGTESIIGLFTNGVCLRTRVDPSISFRQMIRRVHGTIGDAMAHQDVPFDSLVQDLEKSTGTLPSSLFQVLVFWRVPQAHLSINGCETSPYRLYDDASTVMVRNSLDLKVEMEERATTIVGSATYNMTRFSPEVIHGFVDSMQKFVTLAATEQSITVADVLDSMADRGVTRVR